MKIFFDLDGTLIDSRRRLYNLFKNLAQECTITFDEYWDLKRDQIDHTQILTKVLKYSEKQVSSFLESWLQLIEENEWLSFDKPFDGVTEYLGDLSKSADLYLVTARQKPQKVFDQVDLFGWSGLFKDMFVTEQNIEKEQLIKQVAIDKNDFIVGDTGKDIQAGHHLGIRSVAVLSGFRNYDQLIKYHPHFIVNNVTEFNFFNKG